MAGTAAGNHEVENHRRKRPAFGQRLRIQVKRLPAVAGGRDLQSRAAGHRDGDVLDRPIVVHDQQAPRIKPPPDSGGTGLGPRAFAVAESQTEKAATSPGDESSASSPPWRRTM